MDDENPLPKFAMKERGMLYETAGLLVCRMQKIGSTTS
jgi:hypothetical protein